MSAPNLSPRDMVKALPVRSAQPMADGLLQDEINRMYVELPTEAWKTQVRKLDQFIRQAVRHPDERAKMAAPYKNFWIVGLIGSGKTTLSKKKAVGRFANDPKIVVSRWIFTELGQELTSIRMQFAEWLEILERDIRYKVGMRGNDTAKDFAIILQDEKDQLFATPMVMEGEAVFLENQFRYVEFMIQQACTAGIEQIFIVVDEYDHIIGELEQRINPIARNMIKLLKMFNEETVIKPVPVFMINCATSKIIEAIIQSGEKAYLDRVFYLGQRVDPSTLGQLDEVCLLDSPRSRVDVEAVLACWTGRDDLLPLSSHFITGIESLTERLFRNIAQFYTETILEIERRNKFCDQRLVRQVFDPAIDGIAYENLVDEIRAYGFADALVKDVLDLFLVGPNSVYFEQEAQRCLKHHSANEVSTLLDRLVMVEILEKNIETGAYTIGDGRLINVRRTVPMQPLPIAGVPGKENLIRGKCDEVKRQPIRDRLKHLSRFFGISLGKLVREDQVETKPILGSKWYSLGGEIQTSENYLIVPLRHARLIGGLSSEFNVLIYLHTESIKRPQEGGGGHTISVQSYQDAYKLLREKDCLACLMVTYGQPSGRAKYAIQAYLAKTAEDFPFATSGDRFQTVDLEQSRLTKLVIDGEEIGFGYGRSLLELLAFVGHYVEEDTEDGQLATLFEDENRQELWKKIKLSELLKEVSGRLLLTKLYKDYKTWLTRNEKDNLFAILTGARKQRLDGRPASEIWRGLRDVLPRDMLSMSEREFVLVFDRLHDFQIVERSGRDKVINVGTLMPFEQYLCQLAGEGKNVYGVVQELLATSATQKEIDRADKGRVRCFTKDMMDYVRERGHVKRVPVEGKWGWAERAWENLVKITADELLDARRQIREIKRTKLDTFDISTYPIETVDFEWDTGIEEDLKQTSDQLDVLRPSYERLKSEDLLTELEQQNLTDQLSEVKDKSEAIAQRIGQFKADVVKYIEAVARDLEAFKRDRLAVSGYSYSRSSRKAVQEAVQQIRKVEELAKKTGDSEQGRVYLMLRGLESNLGKASSSLAAAAQKIDKALEQFREAGNLEEVDYRMLSRLLKALVGVGAHRQKAETAIQTAKDAVHIGDATLKDELNELIEEAKKLRTEDLSYDSQLGKKVDEMDTERAGVLEVGQLSLEMFDVKRLVQTCTAIIKTQALLMQLFELNGKGAAQVTRQLLRRVQSICRRQKDNRGQQWHDAYMEKVDQLPTPRLYKAANLDVYRSYYDRVKAWQEAAQALFQELRTDIENTLSNDARKLWRAILQNQRLTEEELQDATKLLAEEFHVAREELIRNGLARTATILLAEEV